ncbi:cytochrome c oxidase subunit 1 [Quaeritorhiza haematococci]|nr:cytochrome c oxidase subunit 1 [Quaeritorhiza haematococci]
METDSKTRSKSGSNHALAQGGANVTTTNLQPQPSSSPSASNHTSEIIQKNSIIDASPPTAPPTAVAPKPTQLTPGTSLRVVQAHHAEDGDELELEVGDVVELHRVPESDDAYWWEGINRSWGPNNGLRGFFPSSCVVVENWDYPVQAPPPLPSEFLNELADTAAPETGDTGQPTTGGTSDEPPTVPLDPVPPGTQVIVKYPFERMKADELGVEVGDIIVVLEAPEGGWWRGMKNLAEKSPQMGWFPSTVVALISDDKKSATTDATAPSAPSAVSNNPAALATSSDQPTAEDKTTDGNVTNEQGEKTQSGQKEGSQLKVTAANKRTSLSDDSIIRDALREALPRTAASSSTSVGGEKSRKPSVGSGKLTITTHHPLKMEDSSNSIIPATDRGEVQWPKGKPFGLPVECVDPPTLSDNDSEKDGARGKWYKRLVKKTSISDKKKSRNRSLSAPTESVSTSKLLVSPRHPNTPLSAGQVGNFQRFPPSQSNNSSGQSLLDNELSLPADSPTLSAASSGSPKAFPPASTKVPEPMLLDAVPEGDSESVMSRNSTSTAMVPKPNIASNVVATVIKEEPSVSIIDLNSSQKGKVTIGNSEKETLQVGLHQRSASAPASSSGSNFSLPAVVLSTITSSMSGLAATEVSNGATSAANRTDITPAASNGQAAPKLESDPKTLEQGTPPVATSATVEQAHGRTEEEQKAPEGVIVGGSDATSADQSTQPKVASLHTLNTNSGSGGKQTETNQSKAASSLNLNAKGASSDKLSQGKQPKAGSSQNLNNAKVASSDRLSQGKQSKATSSQMLNAKGGSGDKVAQEQSNVLKASSSNTAARSEPSMNANATTNADGQPGVPPSNSPTPPGSQDSNVSKPSDMQASGKQAGGQAESNATALPKSPRSRSKPTDSETGVEEVKVQHRPRSHHPRPHSAYSRLSQNEEAENSDVARLVKSARHPASASAEIPKIITTENPQNGGNRNQYEGVAQRFKQQNTVAFRDSPTLHSTGAGPTSAAKSVPKASSSSMSTGTTGTLSTPPSSPSVTSVASSGGNPPPGAVSTHSSNSSISNVAQNLQAGSVPQNLPGGNIAQNQPSVASPTTELAPPASEISATSTETVNETPIANAKEEITASAVMAGSPASVKSRFRRTASLGHGVKGTRSRKNSASSTVNTDAIVPVLNTIHSNLVEQPSGASMDTSVAGATGTADSESGTANGATTPVGASPGTASPDRQGASSPTPGGVRTMVGMFSASVSTLRHSLSSRSVSMVEDDQSTLSTTSGFVLPTPVPPVRKEQWQERIPRETLEKMSAKEKKRLEAIWELIVTERDYVRDLGIIIDVFMKPMSERKIISAKQVDQLFHNIEVLSTVNQEFLSKMEERAAENVIIEQIGDLFLKMGDKLITYTLYCSNHSSSLVKLQHWMQSNKVLRQFLDSGITRNLDLASFLIKPVQRICKYPLLIKEIMKQTEESSPDSPLLKDALEKLQAIINIVNEGARQIDGTRRIEDIQSNFSEKLNIVTPSRYLVREDALYLMLGAIKKPRRLFLFNDLIIVARKDWRDKYHLIEKASLRDCRVCDVRDDSAEGTANIHMFEIEVGSVEEDEMRGLSGEPTRYLFACNSKSVKQGWLDAYRNLTQLSIRSKHVSEATSAALTASSSAADYLEGSDDDDENPQGNAFTAAKAKITASLLSNTKSSGDKTRPDLLASKLNVAETKLQDAERRCQDLKRKVADLESRNSRNEQEQKELSEKLKERDALATSLKEQVENVGRENKSFAEKVVALEKEKLELLAIKATAQKERADFAQWRAALEKENKEMARLRDGSIEKIKQLTEEVVKHTGTIKQLRSDLETSEKKNTEMEAEKESCAKAMHALEQELQNAKAAWTSDVAHLNAKHSQEKIALAAERDRFADEVREAKAQISSLNEEMKQSVAQRDDALVSLKEENAAVVHELTAVRQSYENLTREHRELKQYAETLSQERDSLSKDKETLTDENKGLKRERQTLTQEKQKLVHEKQALSKEKEVLIQEKRSLTEEVNDGAKQQQELFQANQRLYQEIQMITQDREAILQRTTAEMEALKTKSAQKLDKAKASLSEARQKIKDLEQALKIKDDGIRDKDTTIGHLQADLNAKDSQLVKLNETMEHESKEYQKTVTDFENHVAELLRDKESLAEENKSLKREREALTQEKQVLLNEKEALVQEKRSLSEEVDDGAKQLQDLFQANQRLYQEIQMITQDREAILQHSTTEMEALKTKSAQKLDKVKASLSEARQKVKEQEQALKVKDEGIREKDTTLGHLETEIRAKESQLVKLSETIEHERQEHQMSVSSFEGVVADLSRKLSEQQDKYTKIGQDFDMKRKEWDEKLRASADQSAKLQQDCAREQQQVTELEEVRQSLLEQVEHLRIQNKEIAEANGWLLHENERLTGVVDEHTQRLLQSEEKIQSMQTKIDDLKGTLSKSEDQLKTRERELKNVSEKLSTEQEQIQLLERSRQSLLEQIERTRTEHKEVCVRLDETLQKLEKTSVRNSDLEKHLQESERNKAVLDQQIASLKEMIEHTRVQNKELTEANSRLLGEAGKMTEAVRKHTQILQDAKQDCQNREEQLARRQQELMDARIQINELETKFRETDERKQALEKEIVRLKEEMSRSEVQYEDFVKERNDMMAKKDAEIEHLYRKLMDQQKLQSEAAQDAKNQHTNLQGKLQKAEESIATLRQAHDQTQQDRTREQELIQQLERVRQDLMEQVERGRVQNKELEDSNARLITANQTLKEKRADLKERCDELNKSLQRALQEKQTVQAQMRVLQDQIVTLGQGANDIKDQLDQARAKSATLERQLQDSERERCVLDDDMASIRAADEHIRLQNRKLAEANGSLLREAESLRKLTDEQNQKIQDLDTKVKDGVLMMEDLKRDLAKTDEQLRSSLQDLTESKVKIKQLETRAQENEERKLTLEKEVNRLKEEHNRSESLYEKFMADRNEEVKRKDTEIENLFEQIMEYQQRYLDSTQNLEGREKDVLEKLRHAEDTMAKLRYAYQLAQQDCAREQELVQQLERSRQELMEQVERTSQALKAKTEDLTTSKGTEEHLRAQNKELGEANGTLIRETERLTALKNEHTQKIQSLEDRLRRELLVSEELKRDGDEQRRLRQQDLEEIQTKQSKIQSLESTIGRLQQDMKDFKERLNRSLQELQQASIRNKELEKDLQRIEHLEKAKQDLAEANNRLLVAVREQSQSLREAGQERQRFQSQIQSLQEKLEQSTQQVRDAKDQLERLGKELQQSNNHVQSLEASLREFEQKREDSITRTSHETEELLRTKDELIAKMQRDSEQLEESRARDRERFQQQEEAQHDLLQQIDWIRTQNRELTEANTRLLGEYQQLKEVAQEIEERLQTENSLLQERFSAQADELKEKRKALSNLRKRAKEQESDLTELSEKMKDLEATAESLALENNQIESARKIAEEELKSIKQRLSAAEKDSQLAHSRLEMYQELDQKYVALRQHFETMSKELRSQEEDEIQTRRNRNITALIMVINEIAKSVSLPPPIVEVAANAKSEQADKLKELSVVPSRGSLIPKIDDGRVLAVLSKIQNLQTEREKLVADLDLARSQFEELQGLNDVSNKEVEDTLASMKRLESKVKESQALHKEEVERVQKQMEPLKKEIARLRLEKANTEKTFSETLEQQRTIEKEKVSLEKNFIELFERLQNTNANHSKDVASMAAKNASLQKDIEIVQAELNVTLSSKEELTQKIHKLRDQVWELEVERDNLKERIDESNEHIRELEMERNNLKQRIEESNSKSMELREELQNVRSENKELARKMQQQETKLQRFGCDADLSLEELQRRRADLKQMQKQLAEAEREMNVLRGKLQTAEIQSAGHQKRREEIEHELAKIRQDKYVLEQACTRNKMEIAVLQTKLASMHGQIVQSNKEVSRVAQSLKAAFACDDPSISFQNTEFPIAEFRDAPSVDNNVRMPSSSSQQPQLGLTSDLPLILKRKRDIVAHHLEKCNNLADTLWNLCEQYITSSPKRVATAQNSPSATSDAEYLQAAVEDHKLVGSQAALQYLVMVAQDASRRSEAPQSTRISNSIGESLTKSNRKLKTEIELTIKVFWDLSDTLRVFFPATNTTARLAENVDFIQQPLFPHSYNVRQTSEQYQPTRQCNKYCQPQSHQQPLQRLYVNTNQHRDATLHRHDMTSPASTLINPTPLFNVESILDEESEPPNAERERLQQQTVLAKEHGFLQQLPRVLGASEFDLEQLGLSEIPLIQLVQESDPENAVAC